MSDRNNMINYLETGLRVSSLRSKTIASNLANLETDNYRRKTVSFEDRLSEAMGSSGDVRADSVEARVIQSMAPSSEDNGNNVNLDVEVGELVKNSARYKTYMRVMAKMYTQMDMAMQTD